MTICDYQKCTGCSVCMNVCPVSCISIREDEYGELHPYIDTDSCLSCGKCQKYCPSNAEAQLNNPMVVYAAVRKEKSQITRCAAGGAGSLIMEYCYENGWSIYAARWDDRIQLVHKKVMSKDEIEVYKGSKYVQSYVGGVYKEIRKELDEGEKCLFIGTPCQCAGLKTFLNDDYENLLIIDLVCHGVNSQRYLNEELEYLLKGREKDNVTFRGRDLKEDQHLCVWNKGKVILNHPGEIDYYFKGYSDGVTLRESCYQCSYAKSQRVGDITLGDFHGLKQYDGKRFRKNCVNVVLINTESGRALFEKVKDELDVSEHTLREAVQGNRCLYQPWNRHTKQKLFRKLLLKYSYPKAIRKTLRRNMVVAFINKVNKYIKIRVRSGSI